MSTTNVLTRGQKEGKMGLIAIKRVVSPYSVTVMFCFAMLLGCNRALVPDARLREVFYANRDDFSKLVSMSQQDRALVRISYDLTLMQTESGVKKNVGLSEGRWQEYRVLFKKLGITGGLERLEAYPTAVLFYERCEGSAINADCKGFAYSEKPLLPITTSLDSPRSGDVFEQLCPDWYLFRWVS